VIDPSILIGLGLIAAYFLVVTAAICRQHDAGSRMVAALQRREPADPEPLAEALRK
jgi:hypothetical protein